MTGDWEKKESSAETRRKQTKRRGEGRVPFAATAPLAAQDKLGEPSSIFWANQNGNWVARHGGQVNKGLTGYGK